MTFRDLLAALEAAPGDEALYSAFRATAPAETAQLARILARGDDSAREDWFRVFALEIDKIIQKTLKKVSRKRQPQLRDELSQALYVCVLEFARELLDGVLFFGEGEKPYSYVCTYLTYLARDQRQKDSGVRRCVQHGQKTYQLTTTGYKNDELTNLTGHEKRNWTGEKPDLREEAWRDELDEEAPRLLTPFEFAVFEARKKVTSDEAVAKLVGCSPDRAKKTRIEVFDRLRRALRPDEYGRDQRNYQSVSHTGGAAYVSPLSARYTPTGETTLWGTAVRVSDAPDERLLDPSYATSV